MPMPSVKLLTPELGGLRMTHPYAPGFDRQLAILYGVHMDLVAELKPYIVMLSNDSNQKIIAYSVLVQMSTADGFTHTQPCLYLYPNAVRGNHAIRGREIFPGEIRVVTLDYWEIDPSLPDLDWFLPQHAQILKTEDNPAWLKGATNVEVSLDAVLYEDGRLIGPDAKQLAARFTDELRAMRELYKNLLNSPTPAQSLKALFDQSHLHVYLKRSGREGSENLPDLDELLKRQSEIPKLQRRCIENTNSLLRNHGEQKLIELMLGILQYDELAIHPSTTDNLNE